MPRPSKTPCVAAGIKYAEDVLAGTIDACLYVRLACQRFFDNLEQSKKKAFPYKFDKELAESVIQFFQRFPHVKGEWARVPKGATLPQAIINQPWQSFIDMNVFGWIHKTTGLRRFKKVYEEVPRKNAKSTKSALVGLYLGFQDNEPGAEVYCGATTERQAFEVFRTAYQMADRTPGFKRAYEIELSGTYKKPGTIHRMIDGSRFEVVVGQPGDGASPHCAIVDEYHEHATSAQVDTMLTGMGARTQPLLFIITTAGDTVAGPCFEERANAVKVLQGEVFDEELFAIIYTIDASDDWQNFEVWKKANPNFGVSVSEDYLRARYNEAMTRPALRASRLTKHLDMWVQEKAAYFDGEAWRACADDGLQIEDFQGQSCWVGIDLADRRDFSSMEIVIRVDGQYYIFSYLYQNEYQCELEENTHYRQWANKHITVTPGNTTDHSYLVEDFISLQKILSVEAVVYDRNWSTYLRKLLIEEAGVGENILVEMAQGGAFMSGPMKEFDALMREGRLTHDGNQAMSWMIGNVIASSNVKKQIYPSKSSPDKKIDGPVAAIMALDRAMMVAPEPASVGMEVWN